MLNYFNLNLLNTNQKIFFLY